jgi:hypothetical protein
MLYFAAQKYWKNGGEIRRFFALRAFFITFFSWQIKAKAPSWRKAEGAASYKAIMAFLILMDLVSDHCNAVYLSVFSLR